GRQGGDPGNGPGCGDHADDQLDRGKACRFCSRLDMTNQTVPGASMRNESSRKSRPAAKTRNTVQKVPATAQAIRAPYTPVARAKLRGREKTPAPTIDPTTIAVSVVSGNFFSSAGALVSTDVTRPPPIISETDKILARSSLGLRYSWVLGC